MKMKMKIGIQILLYFVIVLVSEASHFRGGTISWQPTGIGYGVQFSFKLGWRYGQGPGCTPALIGSLVTGMTGIYWRCTSGCNSTSEPLSSVNYICTGASVAEDWEQGERSFEYTFPGEGPFVVEVQYGCRLALQIPVADVDGDILRCRWSTGSECVSVCSALPYASLDSETCTITFPSNHTMNGIYAVAVTVEDFPRSNILIGGTTYTPSDPMTSVHLQFLVRTPSLSGGCDERPIFVNNTPPEGAIFSIMADQTLHISFYVASNQTITRVDVTSPAGMTYTSPLPYPGRPGVVFINTTWTPTTLQIGSHILCALAEDNNGKASDSRCVEIRVYGDISPCVYEPCLNNGTCIRQGVTQNITCSCIPGYTDRICQTDIDECEIDPCTFLFDCFDGLNNRVCKLNEFKLAAIVTALALTIGITAFIIYKNKKKYKEVDHSWLSNYLDVRKPDSHPKLVYQPQSFQNLKQPNPVWNLFSFRSKNSK